MHNNVMHRVMIYYLLLYLCIIVPEAPSTVVVESLSDTSIKLSWRPPVSPSGNITGFTITDVSLLCVFSSHV